MKTAIVGYIKGLAFQLAGRGVRANVVSPGNTYFEGGFWHGPSGTCPDLYATPARAEPDRPDGDARGDGPSRRLPRQPGLQLHDRRPPGRRRRAHPRHPALTAGRGRPDRRRARTTGRATPGCPTVPAWRSSIPSGPTHPEPDDEAEPDFEELAADLSDHWLVEVAVSDEGDDGCFGPLTARAAWDLAVGVDDRRPGWMVSVVPLYVAGHRRGGGRPLRRGRRVAAPDVLTSRGRATPPGAGARRPASSRQGCPARTAAASETCEQFALLARELLVGEHSQVTEPRELPDLLHDIQLRC